TSKTTTAIVEGEQVVCSSNNTTTFGAAGNGLTSEVTCGCSSGKNSLRQRSWGYNKIVTTVGANPPTTTYTTTSGPTHTVVVACQGSAPSITLSPNPQIISGAPSTVVTGQPVAAATSNSSSVISNTTNAS